MTKGTRTILALGGGALVLLLAMRGNASAPSAPTKAPPSGGSSGTDVRTLAAKLAADINARGYDYSRPLCKSFQIAAGIPTAQCDGIYGPQTRTYLGKYIDAPPALFRAAKKAG